MEEWGLQLFIKSDKLTKHFYKFSLKFNTETNWELPSATLDACQTFAVSCAKLLQLGDGDIHRPGSLFPSILGTSTCQIQDVSSLRGKAKRNPADLSPVLRLSDTWHPDDLTFWHVLITGNGRVQIRDGRSTHPSSKSVQSRETQLWVNFSRKCPSLSRGKEKKKKKLFQRKFSHRIVKLQQLLFNNFTYSIERYSIYCMMIRLM